MARTKSVNMTPHLTMACTRPELAWMSFAGLGAAHSCVRAGDAGRYALVSFVEGECDLE